MAFFSFKKFHFFTLTLLVNFLYCQCALYCPLNVIFYYMYLSCCQHAAKKFLDMDFVVIIAVLPWYIICNLEIIGSLFFILDYDHATLGL